MVDSEILCKFATDILTAVNIRNSRIEPIGLVYLFERSPNLAKVVVTNSHTFTDDVLKSISKLEHLGYLDISVLRSAAFSSDGIEGLFKGAAMAGLARLILRGCTVLTDQHLLCLSRNANNIVELDCEGSFQVGNVGLQAVLSLPKLQILNISYCWKITDDGWDMPMATPTLQIVSMQFCYQLTGRIVPKLKRCLTGKCFVDLSHCDFVTSADKLELEKFGLDVS